jgi:hypothetical protein
MVEPALPPEPADEKDEKDTKRREKEARRLESERGPMDPALRYRALQNSVEMAQDLIELADRKARFALVIISVLNAVALVLAIRGGEAALPRTGAWARIVQVELALYVLVTVYFIWQAIEALRPRGASAPPNDRLPDTIVPGASMRLLFHADIVRRDRATYRRLWEGLRMDNLIAELAEQMHTLGAINAMKYAALTRLYRGVSLMTVMLLVTLATIAAWHLTR